MRASDWVVLVLSGIRVETDMTALRTLMAQTGRVVSAPRHRKTARVGGRWEAGVRDLVRAAAPGGDEQLTFVRARIDKSGESLDLVQGLVGGTLTLDGLAVDVDLRWTLLQGPGARRSGR